MLYSSAAASSRPVVSRSALILAQAFIRKFCQTTKSPSPFWTRFTKANHEPGRKISRFAAVSILAVLPVLAGAQTTDAASTRQESSRSALCLNLESERKGERKHRRNVGGIAGVG